MSPAAVLRGYLPAWNLVFNHNGGYGNIESAVTIEREKLDFSALSPKTPQPSSVHGVLLKLSRQEFSRLAWEEYAYDTVEVPVEVYPVDAGGTARVQHALAFKTAACAIAHPSTLPSGRYINLIREGARDSGIEQQYRDWLDGIPAASSYY